jgi:hypothetical protein
VGFCRRSGEWPRRIVIPAEAGIHFCFLLSRSLRLRAAFVVPAKAGTERLPVSVIPAQAGIHFAFVFRVCGALSRKPAHVHVFFRPPSWRPSHFLLERK